MKTTLRFITGLALGILAIDFLGFCAWIFSGQTPVDSFFIGAITKAILSLFI